MKNENSNGFTLIEMLGVVAAVALLAAALLVPMIKKLDALAQRQEAETLKTLAAAYRAQVTSSSPKIVPSQNTWAAEVAGRLGLPVNEVTNNRRGLQRIFLIDPSLELGPVRAANLPYMQNLSNNVLFTTAPVSPRFMLVSSLSARLPTNLVTGVGGTNGAYSFNNLWSTAPDSVPSGWSWTGRGEDLQIERFNIADLFVQVILNNRDTNLVPRYQIDDALQIAVPYGGRRTYFIKGSELKLINAVGVLEYSEVLTASKSFTFEFGTWQGEAFVATAVSQTSPLDLQKVMNTFMNAPANPAAKAGATQLAVSNALVNFLNAYSSWRDAGYPGQFQGQGNPPKAVEDAQTALANVTANLLTRP